MKGVRSHVYWCASSTKQGFENLILAKWNSMRHVANKHQDHPEDGIEPRSGLKLVYLILDCQIVTEKPT